MTSDDDTCHSKPDLRAIANEELIEREKENDAYFETMARKRAFRYQPIVDLYRREAKRAASKARLTVIVGGAGPDRAAAQEDGAPTPAEDEGESE